MKIKQVISTTQAVKMAQRQWPGITVPTVIKYAKQFKLGFQFGGKYGRWKIDSDKWRRFLDGTLESIRKGKH